MEQLLQIITKVRKKTQKKSKAKNNSQRYYLGEKFPDIYFTYRQAQCMICFLRGLSNAKTGLLLKISVRTVDDYLKDMKKKLFCHSKKRLIQKILESDFLRNLDLNIIFQLKGSTSMDSLACQSKLLESVNISNQELKSCILNKTTKLKNNLVKQTQSSISRFKILLVEDDKLVQKAQKFLLESEGFEVDVANNGNQALAMFQLGYDAIVLDVNLPDMSGLSVSRAIRSHEKGVNLPIIGLTSESNEMKDECLAAGYNEVKAKPLNLKEFSGTLREYLRK